MKFKDLTKWAGIFILGAALIIVYKTFDNLGGIIVVIRSFFRILRPALVGMGLAYVLYPASLKMEHLFGKVKIKFIAKRRRAFGVLSVYTIALSIVALLLMFAINPLVASIKSLVDNLESIIGGINATGLITLNYNDIMKAISLEQLITYVNLDNLSTTASILQSVGNGFFNGLLTLVVSIYTLLDRDSLKTFVDRIGEFCFKERAYTAIKQYLSRFNEFVHKYLFCLLIDAVIVGAASFILLSLMQVNYAPILSLIMALFNVIPYFGSLLSGIIAVVVTAFTTANTMQAVWVAVALLILQQVDGNYVQPRLASHQLKVSPFWVIIGVLVGGGMFGLLGIMLAAPVTAFIKTVTNDLFGYLEKKKKGKSQ